MFVPLKHLIFLNNLSQRRWINSRLFIESKFFAFHLLMFERKGEFTSIILKKTHNATLLNLPSKNYHFYNPPKMMLCTIQDINEAITFLFPLQ